MHLAEHDVAAPRLQRQAAALGDALRESEHRHRTMISVLGEGVVLHDGAGRASSSNPRAEEILGVPAAELRGRFLDELGAPAEAVRSGVAVRDRPVAWRRPDGTVRELLVSSAPLTRSDGGPAYAVATSFSDVTELVAAREELERRAEALERSNEELVRFASIASHDLATPARVVVGYTDMLLDDFRDALPGASHAYVEAIARSGERMLGLISDLLAYAQLDGRSGADEPVDLAVLVREVADDLAHGADGGVPVRATGLPVVRGDAGQLRLVLENLVSNAMKFTPRDAPAEVLVGASVQDGWATVTVADDGIGFAVGDAERIFEPLRRLVGDDEYAGTGLGLAICRRVVERHGGRIWAEAAPGAGSRFHFTLPVGGAEA